MNNTLKVTDEYGNNVNFSDDILSDISTKGLLGKWTSAIYHQMVSALARYHMKTNNIDVGCFEFTKNIYSTTAVWIDCLTQILEDLTAPNIYGIECIFNFVFGLDSDEAYVAKAFLKLADTSTWKKDDLWTDCASDEHLKTILRNEIL